MEIVKNILWALGALIFLNAGIFVPYIMYLTIPHPSIYEQILFVNIPIFCLIGLLYSLIKALEMEH